MCCSSSRSITVSNPVADSAETVFAASQGQEEAESRPAFIYTDKQAYVANVLAYEASDLVSPFGDIFQTFGGKDGSLDLRRICLNSVHFAEQNIFFQAILPFFIEGASPIETCPDWHYFLVYNHAGQLMAFFTVYEAHLTYERIRAKVSQVLVLHPYQRQGIASAVYELIYSFFLKNPSCFQVQVEDSAEDF